MLAHIEPHSVSIDTYMQEYRTPVFGPTLQDGGSLGSFFSAIAPHALSLGKSLISNPQVQASAQEIGKAGLNEIMKSIKSRQAKQKGQGLSKSSRAKLNSMLSGGCLRIIK